MTTKITSANIDTTSVATATSVSSVDTRTNTANFNIALLGFKMAITEGLTVFNLIDGIVDEFEDEGGTDASASTNLTYNSTDDYYVNNTSPTGVAFCTPASFSAGFTVSSVTEPDTSTAGTNPTQGSGTSGEYTVPNSTTSLNVFVWGAGGAPGAGSGFSPVGNGGGGGFSSGVLAVTPGQVFDIHAGEGGSFSPLTPDDGAFFGGGSSSVGYGGGLSGVFVNNFTWAADAPAPSAYIIAGSGGGGGYMASSAGTEAGQGGGLTGGSGGSVAPGVSGGGGGSQSAGGAAGSGPLFSGQAGQRFKGGDSPRGGAGGAGYYGGGGGGGRPDSGGQDGYGGGGSAYIGHPQITSGSTSGGGATGPSAGSPNPNYPSIPYSAGQAGSPTGQDGFVLLTGCGSVSTPGTTTTSTIISDPFTANTVPTTTRLVVFEENVGSPTLNTDIIASVSRNGGSNFTNVTLTDSGYVTGSSGQRILTGQASISGQPSGQSMKWKLQLANQTVKIHGVSLQWS